MLFKEQKQEKATLLQIRMKESEKEALRNLAEKHNMTLTDFIKKACNVYADILSNKEK